MQIFHFLWNFKYVLSIQFFSGLFHTVFFFCFFVQIRKIALFERLTHTLLPRTLCSLAHFADPYFAPQNILLLRTFCPSTRFHPWNPSSICSCSVGHILEHKFYHLSCWAVKGKFAPWKIFLLCKMFSPAYFAHWNTKSKVFYEAKCTMKQSVPRRKVF